MKTIVITITQGRIVRDILRTDIFKVLRSDKNLRIVLAVLYGTPFFNNKNFEAEFSGANVIVKNIHVRANILERLLTKLAEITFFNINYAETIKIKDGVLKHKRPVKYLGLKILRKILGKNKNLISALEQLNTLLFSYKNRYYKELFKTYKPSLVLATDFPYPNEWGVVKAAKHYKVPVIAIIPSWDFLTKGRIPLRPDRVILWDNFLENQLIEYYGYKPNEIFVSGIPQFDYYVRDRNKLPSKKEFLKSLGVNENKKLITYTTSPPTLSPLEQDVIEIICEAIKGGEIAYPSHVHVRFHPSDVFSRHKKLKKYGDIITFEIPGKSSTSTKFLWAPDTEDMLHFAALLANSDVVINTCSTVTIDASAFDTPVINIAFDGYEKKPYFESVVRYYDYTHYLNIVRTRGAKIARGKKELIKYINEYLKNPKRDSRGRRNIVEEMCYKLDGKAGERIGKYILKFK